MEKENLLERITVNPAVMVGKPTIRGMRITVEQILKALANGLTTEQLLEDYPDLEKELAIVKKHLPAIEDQLLKQLVNVVQQFRQRKLVKVPGVSETIDWAESLLALGYREINASAFDQTLGCVLKSADDINLVRAEGVNVFI